LTFSNKLGESFSCNGDNIAAIQIHDKNKRAHCTDDEFETINQRGVGPTITGTIKVPKKGSDLGYLIQEFAVPGPLKRIFEELVTTTKVVTDLPKKDHMDMNILMNMMCAQSIPKRLREPYY
jgi:hypothetical protein